MFKKIAAGIGLLLLLVIVYGVGIEPRLLLDDEAFEAEIPGLPASWEGARIAMLADFQVGMWLGNTGMIEEAIEDAIEEKVAMVLIAGDFVYRPDSSRVEAAVALLQPLFEAGIPVYAVLGNHDYSLMKESSESNTEMAVYLREQLERAGVHTMENEAVPVSRTADTTRAGQLWLAGIGSVWAGNSDPAQTLAGIPAGAARVVFMHNPESFRGIPQDAAPLALAAHTHGAQIRIFPGERNSWLDIVRSGEVAADGWAADSIGAPGNRLYINRGIGFSTVPIRINCRPELTIITLRGTEGDMPTRGPVTTDG